MPVTRARIGDANDCEEIGQVLPSSMVVLMPMSMLTLTLTLLGR